MTIKNNKEADICFYKNEYKQAFGLYEKNKDYYAMGLCSLLLNDKNNAKKFWLKSKNSCPASQWGLCVLNYIDLKDKGLPTFFQTRAHLEVYLNLFIENGYIEWAQNLISFCDKLYTANPESYKFISRALFSNGYFEMAITFCRKSLRIFYTDPEAFLILSQCYFLLGNLGEALDCVNRSENIVNDYFPVKLFKSIILEEIKKKNEKKDKF